MDTAELKLVSPLLDGMSLLECLNNANGFACYLLKQDDTDEKFVLKHISIPESETNIEALILTGAVSDREKAREYYRSVAEAQAVEVRNWQLLAGHDNLSVFTGFQLEARQADEIGYDFYLLAPYRTSLHTYLQENAMTHLQALNLGIDLCNALSALRDAGYLYGDLKPGNIFIDENGHFTIGDLGIVPLDNLRFSSLPEHYSNCYTAPELSDILAYLNPTVDIYSVGMILYHLFNGNHAPFEEDGMPLAEADKQRLEGSQLPGPIYADYELTEILLKACAFKQENRYQTPGELRQALMVYMQKNEVSDAMIVSPIDIGENITITPENMDEDAALVEEELALPAPDETPETATPPSDETTEPIVAETAAEPDMDELQADPELQEDAAQSDDQESQQESPPPESEEPADENFEMAPVDSDPPTLQEDAPNPAESAPPVVPVPAAPPQPEQSVQKEACTDPNDSNQEQPPVEQAEALSTKAAPSASETSEPEVSESAGEESPKEKRQRKKAQRKAARAHPAEKEGKESSSEKEVDVTSSLDDILASVSTYIEPEAEKSSKESDADTQYQPEPLIPRRRKKSDRALSDPEHPPKKKKKIWVSLLTVIIILGVLFGAGVVVYRNWYHVVMSNIQTETGGDYIAVTYDVNIENAPLHATCIDTYGNSFDGEFNGTTVVFRNLTPGTQYFVSFSVSSPRKLGGATSVNATTDAAIEIESFTAAVGTSSTSVNLTIVTSGKEPEQWVVKYTAKDGTSNSATFSGHTTTISDLVLNQTYTFELQPPEDIGIVGQTSITYDVIPNVQAEGLHVSSATQDSATVKWTSIADHASSWHITCTGTDYSQEQDVADCSATFTGIRMDAEYTYTLSAEGMTKPMSLKQNANSPTVTSFQATASDAGTIEVSWASDDSNKPQAWLVEYTLATNPTLTTTMKTTQNNTTILQAVPGTSYIVQLLSSDGKSLIGDTVVSLNTPAASNFTEHGFTQDNASLHFYPAPEETNPTYSNLSGLTESTTFTADQSICMDVQAPADAQTADTQDGDDAELLITVVLRDAAGMVMDYFPLSSLWSSMWSDGHYVTVLPRTPKTAGTYQVEVYFNNQFVCKSNIQMEQTQNQTSQSTQ